MLIKSNKIKIFNCNEENINLDVAILDSLLLVKITYKELNLSCIADSFYKGKRKNNLNCCLLINYNCFCNNINLNSNLEGKINCNFSLNRIFNFNHFNSNCRSGNYLLKQNIEKKYLNQNFSNCLNSNIKLKQVNSCKLLLRKYYIKVCVIVENIKSKQCYYKQVTTCKGYAMFRLIEGTYYVYAKYNNIETKKIYIDLREKKTITMNLEL